MSATRTLAGYISRIKFEDLPLPVVEKGKLAIVDAIGNMIGGYPLDASRIFLELSKDLGGNTPEATLLGDGTKVCLPMAAFGNAALSTMLDYSDVHSSESGRAYIWPAALAVPAALAAGEVGEISGKEFIASVVAGYECAARIIRTMDYTQEQLGRVYGSTASVFAAVGAAGRALKLSEDEMLSALGMAGIYTPVSAGFMWLRDDGLTPRKDIKQGWAWMCMAGVFAVVSARKGLRMLQKKNILDGERSLWTMLGMDVWKPEQLTEGLGETFHIHQFRSKLCPGCGFTHTSIVAATGLVKDYDINVSDIERIEVATSRDRGIGFDRRELSNLSDMEFNIPYQVAVALLGIEKGPNWYCERTTRNPEVARLSSRVILSFEEECEQAQKVSQYTVSKVVIVTKSGQQYQRSSDQPGAVCTADEVIKKFITTTSQVIDRQQVESVLNAIKDLEFVDRMSEMVGLLYIPTVKSD